MSTSNCACDYPSRTNRGDQLESEKETTTTSTASFIENAKDPRLDSRSVSSFMWDHSEKKVTIYMPLSNCSVCPRSEEINATFTNKSFHVSVIIFDEHEKRKKELCLGIPSLSHPVLKDQCRARAKRIDGKPHIVIRLPKAEQDKKWASLGSGGTGALPKVSKTQHPLGGKMPFSPSGFNSNL